MSEEKWEEEAFESARVLFLKDMPLVAFIKGYLQACQKRQEEIERLKKLGDRLRQTSSHKLNCGFSSCTCGAVKEQAEALADWNRERRPNE